MNSIFDVDWQAIFALKTTVFEVVVRGTIMYLVMFTLLRVLRRQAGTIGIADLLVIVVIADAAQNGMTGDAKSVTEAVLLIVTIISWDYLFDFLGYKFKFFERVLEPKELQIIKDGKLLRKNMKSEMITYDEVMSQLRQNGVEDISEVKSCRLESDGHFSVITKDGRNKQKSNESKQKLVS